MISPTNPTTPTATDSAAPTSKPADSLPSNQLTPQEIESLRQDKRECSARAEVLWAEILAKKEAARKNLDK